MDVSDANLDCRPSHRHQIRSYPSAALWLLLAYVLTACNTVPRATDTQLETTRVERPAIHTDEAGLWLVSDKYENSLRSSGRLEKDPTLNAYVRSVLCRIAPSDCQTVRLYIVRSPHFNAFMSPNGALIVWSGMLLRAANEAQLAYVLGHEMGHYWQRHSVQRWRSARAGSDLAALFSVAAAAAGVGYIGPIGGLVAMGNLSSFSKDQERDADEIGLRALANANYDPLAASHLWRSIQREVKARPDRPALFFASHPSTDEREETMQTRGKAVAGTSAKHIHEARFRTAIEPFVKRWIADEVRVHSFEVGQALLRQFRDQGVSGGLIDFFVGEIHRRRADEGDGQLALKAYARAAESDDAPTELYRSIGLVHQRMGDKNAASDAFRTYLRRSPNAPDRQMIQSYLN
ncbi:MAG: M48 family metallopeptidase [Pseudomonadota bacterium]